jgi:hypothetical protein
MMSQRDEPVIGRGGMSQLAWAMFPSLSAYGLTRKQRISAD